MQRIAMYPLALLLGVAAVRRDLEVRYYAIPLAGLGALVPTWHVLVQRVPAMAGTSCEATAPCTGIWVEALGVLGGGALPDDVRLVGVPTSTGSTQGNYPPSDWLDRDDWEFDVLVDSTDNELAQAYGVGAFPSFVAVDAHGNVQARGVGALEPAALDALVEAART